MRSCETTLFDVAAGATLLTCLNPRIEKIPRMSPAITIATPAHRAIVARVHQAYAADR
jgi:hypothetical protein